MATLYDIPTYQDPPASSLVEVPIIRYLEQDEKTFSFRILRAMTRAFMRAVYRQLMQPRDRRVGVESCTSYTGACARKARLQYEGAEAEKLMARPRLKFFVGDIIELSMVGLAQLAGVQLIDNNRDLSITGRDGVRVPVHPDGRVVTPEGVSYNVEVKSADTHTFDAWLAQGGPDDTWGYLTQASVEIAAWREAGIPVSHTVFVAVSTGSRQGSIAEWLVPYDPALVAAWHDRRAVAHGPTVPPIPFTPDPETSFLRSKTLQAEWLVHGDPVGRKDKNGNIYGYDVPTGRLKVPTYCSYCAYRSTQCWTTAQMDMDGSRPVWVVPGTNEEGP